MIKKGNPAGDSLPDGWLRIGKNPNLPDPVIARVGVVQNVLKGPCQHRQLPAAIRGREFIRQWFKKRDQFRAGFERHNLNAQRRLRGDNIRLGGLGSPNRSAAEQD